MATLLEERYDLVFVFREDFCETIGRFDEITNVRARHTATDELFRVVDVGFEAELLAGLLGDGDSITSEHLDVDTEVVGFTDGAGRVGTGRVEHAEHTEELPLFAFLLRGDTKGSETASGELLSGVTVVGDGVSVKLGEFEDSIWGSLGASDLFAVLLDFGGNALGDGVERGEFVGLPATLEHLLGLGVVLAGQLRGREHETPETHLESDNSDLVNGVERLDVVRRGKDSSSHEPVGVHTFSNEGIVQTELVGGKCTRLVRAEDINTSQGLDSREFLDDSLATSKVGGANGERGGGDDGQTDRHTNDEEDEGVDEQVVLLRGGNLDMSEE